MKPRFIQLSRHRHIMLTVGTAAIAMVTAIYFIGAPPVPASVGVTLAVAWLLWRTPSA
jgi:hypothetical protein